MSLDTLMEFPLTYRLWMAPFADEKFAPILAHNDMSKVRRVLDVGCGPGTNCPYFEKSDYLGVDFNAAYIEDARRRYQRKFEVADVCTFTADAGEKFDFILLNSVLHHIDRASTERILDHLGTLLTDDGHVHIVELVLPAEPSLPRTLAQLDRGKFPRPLAEWDEIFNASLEQVTMETFPLRGLGITLWQQVYFKGKRKTT
jgi:SAM-dependent methyltransferase